MQRVGLADSTPLSQPHPTDVGDSGVWNSWGPAVVTPSPSTTPNSSSSSDTEHRRAVNATGSAYGAVRFVVTDDLLLALPALAFHTPPND